MRRATKMKLSEVKQLIREALLTERIFGKQAFVYHGSRMSPDKFLDMMAQDEFNPGQGAGAMYGKGLYTVYEQDPKLNTFSGRYGNYVYKLKVNLDGFISFDREASGLIYGKELPVAQQVEILAKKGEIPQRDAENLLEDLRDVALDEFVDGKYTSSVAVRVWRWLIPYVRGIVFTGRNDGPVAVVYDPASIVPVSWAEISRGRKPAGKIEWQKFDRDKLKTAIQRSAMGQFKPDRYSPRTWRDRHGELHREGDKPAYIGVNGIKKWYRHGQLHREGDKPAIVKPNGAQEWWQYDKLHRDGDKPAVIDHRGTQEWWQHDKLHRDGDKPAVIKVSGARSWYKNDMRHRESGPALIKADGERRWYQNDRLHREDGPAIISPDGTTLWYINGRELTGLQVAERVPLEERHPRATELLRKYDLDVFLDHHTTIILRSRTHPQLAVMFKDGEEEWRWLNEQTSKYGPYSEAEYIRYLKDKGG